MFRIITLEREYGCGCANIASELANRLHWKLWDQSLTEEIAGRRMSIAEPWNGVQRRSTAPSTVWRKPYGGEATSAACRWMNGKPSTQIAWSK